MAAALLTAVLVGVVALLQPLERALVRVGRQTRPDAAVRWPPLLWLGLAASVAALSRIAVEGFAHEGRFPLLSALGLAVGVALVVVPQQRAGRRLESEPEPESEQEQVTPEGSAVG